MVTKIRRTKKLKYFGEKFTKSFGNSRQTWQCIDEVISNEKKTKHMHQLFENNDDNIQQKNKIDALNKYLSLHW